AELTGGDAAMNEVARLVVLLPAADGELVVLQRDVQLIALEARYRQNDAQAFGGVWRRTVGRNALDIVGGIPVAAALADAVDQAFHILKAQQQRARQQRNSRHQQSPQVKRP